MYIYADNAGTTKMSPVAIDAMTKCMNEVFGNPSSLHSTGQRAAEVLQKAREDVAEALGADFNEIYFTSGGSEADNQAIRSAALFGAKKGKKHLISTKIEHHAVLIIHTYNYLHLSFSPFFYLLYASCFPRNQSKRQLLHPGPQIGTPDCQRVDNHRSYTHRHRFSFFYQPAHIVYDIKIAILISQIHHHMSRKI